MFLELRWKPSLSATCLHAAACRLGDLPAADPQLAAALDVPSDALFREIADSGWEVGPVVEQLVALASQFDNNRELVTRCVSKLSVGAGPDGEAVGRVAGAIADLEAALARQQPRLAEELAVRGGPLRDQWEARAAGLLIETARLADASIAPESVEVVLVAPYVGGYGRAHALANRVTFEAVLVNPLAELPEIVRLAWLVCQLNQDLPKFADALPPGGAGQAFALAVVPAVLAGAEAVELAHCDEATVELALDAWQLRGDLPADVGAQLWQWWSAWMDGPKVSWGVAVAALARMMG